ncbi:MAG TPA: nucleoside hydrolase [Clostridiales bacterium]|nr:nucleoside hydrolase [Clostridiales bacterium]
MLKRRIIIDTDPGLDDAAALFIACSAPELDIKAVTTVAGNQTLDKVTENAKRILGYLKSSNRFAVGARGPLIRELETAPDVHGDTGLGTVVFPHSSIELDEKNAYEVIYEEALEANGELEILALGPLTNIAMTMLIYPEIEGMIKHITLMGGSCYIGNYTPAAEFNIFVDPEAAKIVFESGIPITMIGLDATYRAYIMPDEIDSIFELENDYTRMLKQIIEVLAKVSIEGGFKGAIMHDPLATASLIDPGVIDTREYYVAIETKGEYTRGKTVVDIYNVTGRKPNAQVAIDADRQRFIKILQKTINVLSNADNRRYNM